MWKWTTLKAPVVNQYLSVKTKKKHS